MKRKKPFFSPSDTPTSSSVVLGYYISPSGSSPLRRCMGWLLLLLVLLSVSGCGGRHDAMVERLEALQRFNQADSVFTTDSAALVLADYFDAHGDANERMLAHYLLGRAYYDMGETPLALHHYHEAIESADTTDKDCDFRQLGRIHGQTAWLLLKQNALQLAVMEMKKASYYGERCNDTLTIIASYDHLGSAYEKLNLLDSALLVAKRCSELYSKMGRADLSACTEIAVADIYIRQGDLLIADSIIHRYERESGMFDSCHHIKRGKEIFYYTKGLYYLKAGNADSAKDCFRQLLMNSIKINDKECAYEGLSQSYLSMGEKDSALYYSMLAYSYNDSCHRQKSTEEFQRTHSMFNYSRHQRAAIHEKETALHFERWLFSSAIVSICIIIIGSLVFSKLRRDRQLSIIRLNELKQLYKSLKEEESHLRILTASKEDEIQELSKTKEAEVQQLYQSIDKMKTELGRYERNKLLENALKTDIVNALLNSHQFLSPEERKKLFDMMNDEMPGFLLSLRSKCDLLTYDEENICVLIKLRFPLKQISVLLGRDLQNLSSTRTRLLYKVFGERFGGTREFDKMIRNIW